MENISSLSAVVNCKCPRCRKGDIFPDKLYVLKPQRTNEYCSYCQLRFEREPGYFYVAMFVSYAMNVIEILLLGILSYLFGLELEYDNLWYYVLIIMSGILVLSPFNYRYSRVMLLHWLTPGLNYIPGLGDKKE